MVISNFLTVDFYHVVKRCNAISVAGENYRALT